LLIAVSGGANIISFFAFDFESYGVDEGRKIDLAGGEIDLISHCRPSQTEHQISKTPEVCKTCQSFVRNNGAFLEKFINKLYQKHNLQMK
jgi:hypothetical protein